MKSSGGNYSAPNDPAPPANLINPQGQTARATPYPQQQNFLPSDPNAMATGLTPEMVSAIETPPPPPVQPLQAAPPAPARNSGRDGLALLMAMMMGGKGGGPMGWGGLGGGDRAGSSGYGGSATGGPGGFGGSSARGGRAY